MRGEECGAGDERSLYRWSNAQVWEALGKVLVYDYMVSCIGVCHFWSPGSFFFFFHSRGSGWDGHPASLFFGGPSFL